MSSALQGLADPDVARKIGDLGEDSRAAEAELCRRFWQRARLYGIKHLKDVTAAEDLAQRVMEIVLAALRDERVDDLERIDRYVLGVCRNVSKEMRRSLERRRITDARMAEQPEPVVEPPWNRLCVARLTFCCGMLSPREQDVVLMSFHDWMSSPEIAQNLSLRPENVRVIRHRALHKLRDCMDSKEGAPW